MYRGDTETGAVPAGYALDAQNISKSSLAQRQYQPPTPRQKLLKQKEELTAILARIDNAIAVLDANPGMEEFLDVTQGLI